MERGDRLRVMVLVDSLAPGGTEISTTATLPLLRSHGIDAQLLILKSMMPDRGEAQLRGDGTPVRNLATGNGPLRAARALRPILLAERPDVLHTSLFAPIVGGSLAAIGTGIPVLASIVNTPPEMRRGRRADTGGARWKVRSAAVVESLVARRLVAHVHAVTPGVRDAVVARQHVPADRITVAERGRDATRFTPADAAARAAVREELGLTPEDEVVVSLGRQEPQKGLLDLVDAAELVLRDRPRLKVLLAGREGADTPALGRRIARGRTAGRVVLLGDRADPERLLAAADLFVLSSLREGASGATIEAMAMGVPIVATDVAGLRGITVDGHNARLVTPASPAALAGGIVELLDDAGVRSRLGAAGRETFLRRFTLDRAAEALATLYRQVAAGSPG